VACSLPKECITAFLFSEEHVLQTKISLSEL